MRVFQIAVTLLRELNLLFASTSSSHPAALFASKKSFIAPSMPPFIPEQSWSIPHKSAMSVRVVKTIDLHIMHLKISPMDMGQTPGDLSSD